MTGAPNLGASWQWGQSTTVEVLNTDPVQSAQILNVSLPVPAACNIYLRAELLAGSAGLIWSIQFDLKIGVGRTSLGLRKAFLNQPTLLTPLEFSFPVAQPLTALQCDVTVLGNALPSMRLSIGAELAPVTWIPSSDHSLQFGMALPGEAEGLDDQAYEEMEEYDPDLADAIRAEQESAAPFPAMEYAEEHAEAAGDAARFSRQRRRQFPAEANEHGRQLRRRLRNWNGRNGR